jgi:hypothetical protein
MARILVLRSNHPKFCAGDEIVFKLLCASIFLIAQQQRGSEHTDAKHASSVYSFYSGH